MEHLAQMYSELLKSNPLLGQILPLMLAGSVTWVFRDVPLKLWATIRGQSTTTLNMLSTGAGSADMQYFSFLEWFVQRGFMRWSRSLAVESAYSKDADGKVLPGNGIHYFIWKGRLCWLQKSRVEQGGTQWQITHSITVGMIGRNQQLLQDMVDEFRWKPSKERGHLFTADLAAASWSTQHKISPRRLETIVLNAGIMENLVERIQWFLDNRDWYETRGLPYRLVVLLEGPPGTGKTSLLRALTTHFKRNLCPLNLATASEEKLPYLLRNAPAVIRDERVNEQVHLGLLNNEAVHRYISRVFPEHTGEPPVIYAPIAGATLQKLYVRNHESYRDFISAIPVANPDALSVNEEEEVV